MQYGMTRIGRRAFELCGELVSIEIPMSMTSISDDAFGGCDKLTIRGYDKHYAQKYAEKNKLPFIAINAASSVTLQCGEETVTGRMLTIDMASGDKMLALSAIIQPADAHGGVTWKSSELSIASVDSNGLVTGLKPGTATITATAADGSKVKASVKVNVTYLAKEITITGSSTLKSGKQTTLKAAVLPAETVNKKVTWTSSDTAIATVNASGVVTAKKVTAEKTVTITATAKDGSGVYAEFVITVTS